MLPVFELSQIQGRGTLYGKYQRAFEEALGKGCFCCLTRPLKGIHLVPPWICGNTIETRRKFLFGFGNRKAWASFSQETPERT